MHKRSRIWLLSLLLAASCHAGPPSTFEECRDLVRAKAIRGEYTADAWKIAHATCDELPVTSPSLLARLRAAEDCRKDVVNSYKDAGTSVDERFQRYVQARKSEAYQACTPDLWNDRPAEKP